MPAPMLYAVSCQVGVRGGHPHLLNLPALRRDRERVIPLWPHTVPKHRPLPLPLQVEDPTAEPQPAPAAVAPPHAPVLKCRRPCRGLLLARGECCPRGRLRLRAQSPQLRLDGLCLSVLPWLSHSQLLLDMVCLCGESVHAARLVRPCAGHPNREHVRCSLTHAVALLPTARATTPNHGNIWARCAHVSAEQRGHQGVAA